MAEADVELVKKTIKSVKLIKEEETKLTSYQAYLDGLAQGTSISSEIFTNKGKAHASILMATLLANTEYEIKMYCQGLSPGILCGKIENDDDGFEGAYWNEFKHFFEETLKSDSFKPGSVKILIQKQDWIRNKPFQIISQALQDQRTCNKILIRQISPESKSEIVRVLGDNGQNDYNFATFDNKAYRLEYNPNDYQASGSFNNPSWCDILNRLFDSAFKTAKDITNDIRQLDDKELSIIISSNESNDCISQESIKGIMSSLNEEPNETVEEIIKSIREHLKNSGIINPDIRTYNEAIFKEESSKAKGNILHGKLKHIKYKNPSKKYKYNTENHNDNENYFNLNIYYIIHPTDSTYFNLLDTTNCIEEISPNENLPCLLP